MAEPRCKDRICYDDISQRLYRATQGTRIPLDGMIELTMRCNLRCRHCYCIQDATRPELDTNQVCTIIDQVAEAGCLWLGFTGGEILLRKDFLDIYRYAKSKGLLISLLTNGTLLNEKLIRYFATYKPLQVDITLYAITEKTNALVTGVAGMLDKTLRAIRLLKEYAIPFNLKTTVTKDNVSEIFEIKEYAQSLGINYRFDAQIHARIDGMRTPHQCRLGPHEVAELDIHDEERLKDWKMYCQKFWGPIHYGPYLYCSALKSSFDIDAYGRLVVCVLSRAMNEDLLVSPFSVSWDRLYERVYQVSAKKDFACRGCQLAHLCDNCPGWSEVEEGSWDRPSEYLCELTKIRERLFRIHGIIDDTQEGNHEEKIPASQGA